MDDLLKKSAIAYQTLMPYEYKIVGGRKGKTICVTICFPEEAYHHLAGFQYSRIEVLSQQKGALWRVLCDRVTYRQLVDSGFNYFDRLESIIRLQTHLESNDFIFRYRGHEQAFSRLRADYLFSWEDIVFFIAEDTPVSIFKNKTRTDYTKGCPRYTVLQIERRMASSGESVVIYRRTK